MKRIAQTARGKLAKNQSELLKIATTGSKFQIEEMDHPLCDVGFSQYGDNGIERMDGDTFYLAMMSLLKSRPSSRLWEIIPDAPYDEIEILIESPEAFRLSFDQKAHLLKDEFVNRPRMAGFRLELHNVHDSEGDNKTPSASLTIFETSDDLGDTCIPMKIRTKYRLNF